MFRGLILLSLASVVLAAVPQGVEEFTLSNGITVISRYLPGKEVEGLSLFVIGGSGALTVETQGLEAFALECAMMGSRQCPGPDWREIMDLTQAEWTGNYTYDYSRYHLRCLQEDLPLLCECFADCLLHPELDSRGFEQERERMISELRQGLDDPDNRIWQVANRAFMRDHTYRLRPDGTEETISSFTCDDVTEMLENRIRAGNLLITHAGPTPADELKEILEDSFGSVPEGETALPDTEPFELDSDSIAVEHDEVLTAFAVVKFNAPPAGHEDVPAFRAGMQAVDELLWQVLRTEHGLTYATFAGVSGYNENWGYMYVSSPSPVEACSLMSGVLCEAVSRPFDEEIITGVVQIQRTFDAMNAGRMNSQCRLMGSGWITTGDWRTPFLYADIADTLEAVDIQEVLNRWIGHAGWGIIVDTATVSPDGLKAWPICLN